MTDNITTNTASESYIDSNNSENINSVDAVNRIFGYPTYPQTTPSVKFIKVKLEDQINLQVLSSLQFSIYTFIIIT
jgi:hypothetical protein